MHTIPPPITSAPPFTQVGHFVGWNSVPYEGAFYIAEFCAHKGAFLFVRGSFFFYSMTERTFHTPVKVFRTDAVYNTAALHHFLYTVGHTTDIDRDFFLLKLLQQL